MSGNLKGFWKMLTGQGGKEYGEQHRRFKAAIPNTFPTDMTIKERAARHPAYSGSMANSMDAADYRRAHFGGRGPQSKAEHAAFARQQAMMDEYDRQAAKAGESEYLVPFGEWSKE